MSPPPPPPAAADGAESRRKPQDEKGESSLSTSTSLPQEQLQQQQRTEDSSTITNTATTTTTTIPAGAPSSNRARSRAAGVAAAVTGTTTAAAVDDSATAAAARRYARYPRSAGSQEPLFSPQPTYSNNKTTQQPSTTSSSNNPTGTMDHHEARAYDQLDLNEDIMAPDENLFLESFGGDETTPRSPLQDKRLPPPQAGAVAISRRSSPGPSQPPQPSYYSSYASSNPSRRSPRYHPSSNAVSATGSRQPPPPPHYYGYPPPTTPHEGSPPPGYNPRSSPKSSGGGGYYHQGYSPYYHQYHPEQPPHWGEYPQQYDDEDIPIPPSSSKKPRRDHDLDVGSGTTPEKKSPYSPKDFLRKSPFRASPSNINFTGSFGMMDTPSGTLPPAEFSPLGPRFGLEDHPAGPFQQDLIDVMDSANSPSNIPRSSPISDFMIENSPFEMGRYGVTRSPMHLAYHHPMGGQVTLSANRGSGRVNARDSTAKPAPRKLWPREPDHAPPPPPTTPGHVRMEIGGAGSISNRNKLDGINSMMQPRPPQRHDETPSRGSSSIRGVVGNYSGGPPPPPHPHHHLGYMGHPGAHFRSEMATPIKSGSYRLDPSLSARHPTYPGPSGAPRPPSSASSSAKSVGGSARKQQQDYPGSTSKSPYTSQSVPNSARKATPSGKENNGRKKSPGSKRSPCNCKRSKCLKLYCECFAAERFCDGCNCNDCGNTPTAGLIREKAIKETRAKNPNAFKPRIGVKGAAVVQQGTSPQSGHNMGCRCKKSECLKKYCECFQAGVICGGKCKCVDCQNFAGSQALIDKRRKIKDQRGADFAMRVADEAWKGKSSGNPGSGRNKPVPPPSSSSSKMPAPSPMTTSNSGSMPPPHMLHSTPRGPPPPHHPGAPPPPHYMGHPIMMGHPMGFSPMGMPMTPAGYPGHHPGEHHPPPGYYPIPPPTSAPATANTTTSSSSNRSKNAPLAPKVTPVPVSTPKTPAVRIKFDPATSRKKRSSNEPTLPYFGEKYPNQPKTTALAIFSFLSNDDLYNAGLVCKSWSRLAVDEELWKFQS